MRLVPQCFHGYSRLPPQLCGKLLLFLLKLKCQLLKNNLFASQVLKKVFGDKKVLLGETKCPLKRRAISFAPRHVSGCYIASFMHEVL